MGKKNVGEKVRCKYCDRKVLCAGLSRHYKTKLCFNMKEEVVKMGRPKKAQVHNSAPAVGHSEVYDLELTTTQGHNSAPAVAHSAPGVAHSAAAVAPDLGFMSWK